MEPLPRGYAGFGDSAGYTFDDSSEGEPDAVDDAPGAARGFAAYRPHLRSVAWLSLSLPQEYGGLTRHV